MFKWIHHLLNPHCPDCQLEADGKRICESCETVKMQLAIVNQEKRQLLDHIISLTKPVEQVAPERKVMLPTPSAAIGWNVRRQMLEEEDRKKAEVIRQQKKAADDAAKMVAPVATPPASTDDRTQSINELEKELGITEEVTSA